MPIFDVFWILSFWVVVVVVSEKKNEMCLIMRTTLEKKSDSKQEKERHMKSMARQLRFQLADSMVES